ncbi:hypothetical protein OBBRIDRAFT_135495 [Obba rivulosa]|uniref:Uncharacterized protein n=1 Tax=Obba rivulosa TaxID=1052685 RepID=A0A8E2DI78_9APHY|nr:hypothetical protein OBBRIDRAFT_135495 [Obba rivulosa]
MQDLGFICFGFLIRAPSLSPQPVPIGIEFPARHNFVLAHLLRRHDGRRKQDVTPCLVRPYGIYRESRAPSRDVSEILFVFCFAFVLHTCRRNWFPLVLISSLGTWSQRTSEGDAMDADNRMIHLVSYALLGLPEDLARHRGTSSKTFILFYLHFLPNVFVLLAAVGSHWYLFPRSVERPSASPKETRPTPITG